MNFLQSIVDHKREELAGRKSAVGRSSLTSMKFFGREPLSLTQALCEGTFGIIAEIKRASPSAGTLRRGVDPAAIARDYTSNGAAAVSVLTDERFFSGTLADLEQVRECTRIPLLRKEFIIDEYQITEAKAYGADAVLLIAALLETSQLNELFLAAGELGMECLVELYAESEIDKLNPDRMRLVGINNRDLKTFSVDVNKTVAVSRLLPAEMTIVSESGITSSKDLNMLKSHGIRGALIGEYLMMSPHPGRALRQLLDGVQQ